MTGIDQPLPELRRSRWRARLALASLSLVLALPRLASGLDFDPSFGVHGYVPVSAPETLADTAASMLRQPVDDKMVVLGTRLSGTRGTLVLQRFQPDGSVDFLFGTLGLQTVDNPGESLTAKRLFIRSDNRLLVVAETNSAIRLFSFQPNGQVDTTFGMQGDVSIPFATGVGPGFSSVHLLDSGNLLVIAQNSPAAASSITVTRYTADGLIDDLGFGLHGSEVIGNLGTFSYTGVTGLLVSGEIVAVLARSDGARALLFLDHNGELDTSTPFGNPNIVALLQGATVTKVAPLFSGYFLVVAVSGPGGAQASTLTRFDPVGRIDPQFGTNGSLTVQSSDAGGSIAVAEVYETTDNTLVVTGSTNNGMLVARYLARGQLDPEFNAGKGLFVVPEPGSRATTGVMSLGYPSGRIVHLGFGTLFGATPAGPAPSRAFLIDSIQGVPDVDFASKGILNLFGRSAPNSEFIQYVTPLADGRVLVLSSTGVLDGLQATLSRFLSDGSPDPTFGTLGRKTFTMNGRCEWPLSIAIQPDGKVLVVGTSFNLIDCDTGAMYGRRFDTSGVEDNFTFIYSGTQQRGRSGAVALQADGRIVVTGQDNKSLVVARFLTSGAADPAFGTGGRTLYLPNPGDELKGGALLIRPDQKIIVAGSRNGFQVLLLQYNADGTPDTSFGLNGVSAVNVSGSFLEAYQVVSTSAGKLLVLARSGQRALLAQFFANGTPDASFGNGGQILLPLFIGGGQYSRFGMTLQGDGGILVSGQSFINPASQAELMKLTPTGQNDPSFGIGGVLAWRPSIYYPGGATAIAALAGGGLYVGGYGIPGAFLARLGVSVPTAAVVEFYNTQLNHYFITADPAEQAGIDGGSAGPGWTRTGMGFRAYLPSLGLPPGVVPVCRFYGSTAINPATGLRRGPNSHFYTGVAAECAAVQQDPGWTLEGIAFYTVLPDGTCAAGLVPVYRNYNKRAQFNDSNHRYSIDLATYQLMISLGWAGEGIVFCAAL